VHVHTYTQLFKLFYSKQSTYVMYTKIKTWTPSCHQRQKRNKNFFEF